MAEIVPQPWAHTYRRNDAALVSFKAIASQRQITRVNLPHHVLDILIRRLQVVATQDNLSYP